MSPVRCERYLFYILLFLSLGVPSDVFFNPDRIGGLQIILVTDIVTFARLLLPILCITYFMLVGPRGRFEFNTVCLLLISLNLVYVILSWTWGSRSGENIAIVSNMALTVIATLLFGRRNGGDWVLERVRKALVAILVASAVLAIAVPSVATHYEGDLTNAEFLGAWRGIFQHKNVFGPVAVFGLAFQLSYVLSLGRRSWPSFIVLILAVVCVFESQSATAVVGAILAVAVVVFDRCGPVIRLAIGVIGVVALTLIGFYPQEFLGLLGRDVTFTGRVPIWNFWLALAEADWFLGKGFLASLEPEYALMSKDYLFGAAGHSHNAFIEMYFNSGALGLLIFSLLLIVASINLLTHNNSSQFSRAAGAALISSIAMGMFDVGLFRFFKGCEYLVWILLVSASLRSAKTPASRADPAQLELYPAALN